MAVPPDFVAPIMRPPPMNSNMVLVAVFLAISWVVVGLRIWTRTSMRSFGWDDFWMILTLVFFTVLESSTVKLSWIIWNKDGLNLADINSSTNWLIVNEIFYVLVMATLKLSLGLFFLRITFSRWQRWTIYTVMAVSTLYSVAYVFVDIFQCGFFHNPLEFFLKQVTRHCLSKVEVLGLAYTHTTISTVTDWLFALLPIFMLRKSTLNWREKFTVGFLLVLACAGGIASCVRFIYLEKLAVPSYTFWRDVYGLSMCTTVEPGVGIIAGSLATLRPMVRRFLDTTVRSNGSNSNTPKWGRNFDTKSWGNIGDENFSLVQLPKESESRSSSAAPLCPNKEKGPTVSVRQVDSDIESAWPPASSASSYTACDPPWPPRQFQLSPTSHRLNQQLPPTPYAPNQNMYPSPRAPMSPSSERTLINSPSPPERVVLSPSSERTFFIPPSPPLRAVLEHESSTRRYDTPSPTRIAQRYDLPSPPRVPMRYESPSPPPVTSRHESSRSPLRVALRYDISPPPPPTSTRWL